MKPEDIDAFNALMEEAEANRPIHRYAEVPLELMRRVAEAIAGLRWIPVGEQLPEIERQVLGFNTAGYIADCRLRKHPDEQHAFWIGLGGVTHWMPLPAPPETA